MPKSNNYGLSLDTSDETTVAICRMRFKNKVPCTWRAVATNRAVAFEDWQGHAEDTHEGITAERLNKVPTRLVV